MSAGQRLERIGRLSRISLGLIWIYQGIVPKLASPVPFEQEVVAATGLYFGTPAEMIAGIGILETLLGLWLLSGRLPGLACMSASLVMLTLQVMVVWVRPDLMIGPFGCLIKNISLLAAAWVVIEGESVRKHPERRESHAAPA